MKYCSLFSFFVLTALYAESDFISLDSLEHWEPTNKVDGGGWTIDEEGLIHFVPGKKGIFRTKERFLDFELVFEWRISKGGNSGVFYRQGQGNAPEYQILDDVHHRRGQWATSSAAALYDLYGRSDDSSVKDYGQWNTARILAKGNRLQHWLNGVKVVDVEVGSDDWKERFEKSKFTKDPEKTNWDFGLQNGNIWLQNHGGEVWYRGFKIRNLD